jgi:hypothetical protein
VIFNHPIPFEEALASRKVKALLPTLLGSRELSGIASAIKEQSSFSARVSNAELLAGFDRMSNGILNPITVRRADRVTAENPEGWVTEGPNIATARLEMMNLQKALGITAEPGTEGTIADITSQKRIDLKLKTDVQLAQGVGHFIESNDPEVIDQFPCWELKRFEPKKEPRNWPERWKFAARTVGDNDAYRVLEETGRMIARKDSPIWQELGNAEDGLNNPYPPFAFGSGMWTQDIDYQEALQLGLITRETRVQPQRRDWQDELVTGHSSQVTSMSDALKAALIESLGPEYEFIDGILARK